MTLDTEQLEYLTAISALQDANNRVHPSLLDVSKKVHSERVKAGVSSQWVRQPPWHGTQAVIRRLETLNLAEVHVGAAQFHAPYEPAGTPETYWASLTDEGREALATSQEEEE